MKKIIMFLTLFVMALAGVNTPASAHDRNGNRDVAIAVIGVITGVVIARSRGHYGWRGSNESRVYPRLSPYPAPRVVYVPQPRVVYVPVQQPQPRVVYVPVQPQPRVYVRHHTRCYTHFVLDTDLHRKIRKTTCYGLVR